VISRFGRREQLVVAALRLFSERPYEDVSIDDIANEANVAHGLLSYYFGGKRGGLLGRAADGSNRFAGSHASDPIRRRHRGANYGAWPVATSSTSGAHPQVLLGLLASAPTDTETRAITESTHAAGAQALLDLLGLPEKPAADIAHRAARLHGVSWTR